MPNFSIKNMLQGAIGGAAGAGNAIFKPVQAGSKTPGFPRTLNKAAIWANGTSDITLTAAKWVRVGQYTIPAQQMINLGYGVTGGNPEEIGHLHFDLVDDTATNSAVEPGYVRVGYTNANETMTVIMLEERSEDLSDTSSTVGIARSNELLLPESAPMLKGGPIMLSQEDSRLIADFKSDATDVLVYTGIGTGAINKWKLPVTVYQ
ncbi:hypothetical protein HYT53_03555 [Candidatus Woesearchaeota archaeon]|nr:hypothetical protein [Candidatus Woesearchaeota archaeon]